MLVYFVIVAILGSKRDPAKLRLTQESRTEQRGPRSSDQEGFFQSHRGEIQIRGRYQSWLTYFHLEKRGPGVR